MTTQPKAASPLKQYFESLGVRSSYITHTLRIDHPDLFKMYSLSEDIYKHPYWDVDDSEYDAETVKQFGLGNVILNHAIHETSLLMKRETFERFMKSPGTEIFEDYMDWMKISDRIEEEYMKRSEEIEGSGKLGYGYIFTTPVADGCAYYIVTQATPKTVRFEHLCFGDAYHDQIIGSMGGKMSRKVFNQITGFGKP